MKIISYLILYICPKYEGRGLNIVHKLFQNQTFTNKVLFYVAAASTFIAGVLHLTLIPMLPSSF